MTTPALPSYSSGTSTVPLLGDTIGANLDRTAARVGDHEALVECAVGPPLQLSGVRRRGRRRRARPDALGVGKGDRVGIWAPNCAEWVLVQYATAKLGAILVNINPAYRTHELALRRCSSPACRCWSSAPELQDQRLPRDGRRGPRRAAPTCERRRLPRRRPSGSELLADADAPSTATLLRAAGGRRCRSTTRSTSSTRAAPPGFPKGATLTPPQHPQQRLLRRRGLRLHRGRPGLHPGALLPLLRHGAWATSAATSHGARWSSRRRRSTRRRRCEAVQDERCTSLYGVPTMFIAELGHPRLRRLRPLARCAPGSWPARRARSR